jgi:membrane fusion protein, multidrug efflux system
MRRVPRSPDRLTKTEESQLNSVSSQPSVHADEAQTTDGRRARKRRIISFALMAAVLLLAIGGSYYYAYTQSFESTDDAFIEGNVTDLAPKIAGRVDRVFIDDNQRVSQGDLLVVIDPRDYDAALRQKEANLDSFKAQGAAVEATIEQQQAHLTTLQSTEESDQATAEADRANALNAATLLKRNEELFARRVIAPEDLDRTKANADATKATLDAGLKKVAADEAQRREAEYQLKTYLALYQSVQAMIAETDAGLESAKLNRSYAEIRAPADGLITNRTVQTGNYVQVGQVMLSLVPNDLYVVANFKENQLTRMRPGQPVTIHLDPLPGKTFPGRVHSIQAGSGARFSLLPPENATGNYVKVVQRVPVKILFNKIPDSELPIGPGESVNPVVRVQDFSYSPMQLIGIGASVILVLGFINWWGTRQPHSLGPVGGGKVDRKVDERDRIEPRTANGADDQPAKGKNRLAGR